MKYWEIIADRLKKAGFCLRWVSAVDSEGRTIWIVDAHRDDGKRFIVHADEKLSAFVEGPRKGSKPSIDTDYDDVHSFAGNSAAEWKLAPGSQ